MLHTIWQDVFIKPLFNALIFIYNVVPGHDMGIAIIVLTIIISLILYFPNLSAIRGQRAMTKLQPEIKKLQDKYKNDKQKLSEKTMELYKEHKINPLSSCLPLLIQMPILIALYQVFRQSLHAESSNLLYPFVHNPGMINKNFLGLIDLSVRNLYIFPILAGGTQLWLSLLMQKKAKNIKETEPPKKIQDKTAFNMDSFGKQMNYMFPLMTAVISLSLPSAIVLYWITRNLFSVGQQYIFMAGEDKKPLTKKKGVSIRIRKKS